MTVTFINSKSRPEFLSFEYQINSNNNEDKVKIVNCLCNYINNFKCGLNIHYHNGFKL